MDKLIKIFKWLVGIFIALLVLDIFLVASFASFSSQYEKADAIIVLGAAINSPPLYNRSLEALRLYQEGWSGVIVLSGGKISENDITEAAYMQRAILNEIDDQFRKPYENENKKEITIPTMILEEKSHSTFENIKNSKKLLKDTKSVIIVTDKYHLARSVITAKALGFEDVYWSAPKSDYSGSELRRQYFREVAAMFAYLPKFLLK